MSTAVERRALLPSHEERQALIRRPYPITYILPIKRWGGVQIINDEDWMRDANAWRKRYASEDQDTDVETRGIGNMNHYMSMGGTQS